MKTKSTRRVSKQKEVEGAIVNAIQKFRFEDNIRHEVILAALLNSFVFQAEMVGQPLEWFRRAARIFSAAADEIEESYRTAVPLRDALQSPKPRRKTATKTKTRRLVFAFGFVLVPPLRPCLSWAHPEIFGRGRIRTGLFRLRPELPHF